MVVGPTDTEAVCGVILKKAADVGAAAVVMARHRSAGCGAGLQRALPGRPAGCRPWHSSLRRCLVAGCTGRLPGGSRLQCSSRGCATDLPLHPPTHASLRSKGKLKELWVGSVTKAVVHKARGVPVAVVPFVGAAGGGHAKHS